MIYENCTLPVLNGGYATFRDCTIQPGTCLGTDFKFYGCTFKSADGGTMTLKFGGAVNATRIFDNCKFEGKMTTDHFFKSAVFKNCEFDDFSMIVPVDGASILEALYFEKCTINSTASQFMNVGPWTSSVGYLNCVYKDCDITLKGTPVAMTGKTTAGSQIVFDTCTLNKTIDTSDLIKVINRNATKKNGLITESGKSYYYINDVKQTGWQMVEGKTCNFGTDGVFIKEIVEDKPEQQPEQEPEQQPEKKNGFVSEDGKTYYYVDDVKQLGWKQVEKVWYYFGADGAMVMNKWVSYKGAWYYFGEDGVMVTNKWVLYSSKWYYFNASGMMVTGKQTINGKTYNFSSSGAWIN